MFRQKRTFLAAACTGACAVAVAGAGLSRLQAAALGSSSIPAQYDPSQSRSRWFRKVLHGEIAK